MYRKKDAYGPEVMKELAEQLKETAKSETLTPNAKSSRLFDLCKRLRDIYSRNVPLRTVELGATIIAGLKVSGALGNAEAWYELGDLHMRLWHFASVYDDELNDWRSDANSFKVLEFWKLATEAGGPSMALRCAQNLYWHFDYIGYYGTKVNQYQETIWFLERALKDDPRGEAAYLTGLMYFHGYGYPKDMEKSVEWHRIAANKGNGESMFELYALLSTDRGTPIDDMEAFRWCKLASEQGLSRALYNMGTFYATGTYVKKNFITAKNFYEQAAAKDHAHAAYTLGTMYLTRELTADSDAEAVALSEKWFKRALALRMAVAPNLKAFGLKRRQLSKPA